MAAVLFSLGRQRLRYQAAARSSFEPMSRLKTFTRRTFLGKAAAAAAAVPAAGVVATLAGCDPFGSGHASAGTSAHTSRRGPVPENMLAGDPNWQVRHAGGPDAIMGYAGQASVLPGEPVTLYVSTTSREFRVTAFRIGWYRG